MLNDSRRAFACCRNAGENSIIIVGGANQDAAAWQLGDGVRALIHSAGAVLLQREIPEDANIAVAKVGAHGTAAQLGQQAWQPRSRVSFALPACLAICLLLVLLGQSCLRCGAPPTPTAAPAARATAQAAADAGVPVLLDAGGVDAPLPDELLSHLSIISPNESELQRLTGMATDSTAQLLEAAAALQARARAAGAGGGSGLQVLVKLGTAGSMCVGAPDVPGLVRQPAVLAPQVVDTTGAGTTTSCAPRQCNTAACMRLGTAAAACRACVLCMRLRSCVCSLQASLSALHCARCHP